MISFETHNSFFYSKDQCAFTLYLDNVKYIFVKNNRFEHAIVPSFVEMLQKMCDEDVLCIYGLDYHIEALYEKYQKAPFEVEHALLRRAGTLADYFHKESEELEAKLKELPQMFRKTYRQNAERAIEIKAKKWYIIDEHRFSEECVLMV